MYPWEDLILELSGTLAFISEPKQLFNKVSSVGTLVILNLCDLTALLPLINCN